MKSFNKAILKAVIQHQTNKLAEALMPSKDEVELTLEEKTIRAQYLSFTGCGSSESRASYEGKIKKAYKDEGKKLNPKTFAEDSGGGSYIPIALAVVVPMSNPNAHDYTIGAPVAFYRNNDSYAVALEEGSNHMPRDKSSVRIADEEEIDTIIDERGRAILRKAGLMDKDVFFAEEATEENIKAAIALVE